MGGAGEKSSGTTAEEPPIFRAAKWGATSAVLSQHPRSTLGLCHSFVTGYCGTRVFRHLRKGVPPGWRRPARCVTVNSSCQKVVRSCYIELFLDTASIEKINRNQALGLVDGITINRAILAKEGKDPLEQLRKSTSTVSGPVSAVFVRRKDDFAIGNKKLTWGYTAGPTI